MSQESDPNTAIERVDLQSLDVAEEKRQELLRLLPEVRTEGGKMDFDRLKLTLGAAVDAGKERYGLTWPGKAECFRTIQTPSTATLRPMRDESVNFDTTENLIIEGDNLEVLKHGKDVRLSSDHLRVVEALRLSEIRYRRPERCDPGRRTQEHRNHGRPLPRSLQQPAVRALRLRRQPSRPPSV